jgi:hypothetical protein
MKKLAVHIMLFAAIFLLSSKQNVISREITLSAEIIKEISNNISEEYITCGAYYTLFVYEILTNNDSIAVEMTKYSRNAALEYAFLIAQEGRSQEMAEKRTLAKLELNMKSLLEQMKNDGENFSILMNQYENRCQEIMEYPDKMMGEWSYRILKNHLLKVE